MLVCLLYATKSMSMFVMLIIMVQRGCAGRPSGLYSPVFHNMLRCHGQLLSKRLAQHHGPWSFGAVLS